MLVLWERLPPSKLHPPTPCSHDFICIQVAILPEAYIWNIHKIWVLRRDLQGGELFCAKNSVTCGTCAKNSYKIYTRIHSRSAGVIPIHQSNLSQVLLRWQAGCFSENYSQPSMNDWQDKYENKRQGSWLLHRTTIVKFKLSQHSLSSTKTSSFIL